MKVFKLLNRGYKRLRNLERYWSPRQCQHCFDHVIKTNPRNKYCLKFSCKFLLEHYFRTFLGVRAHSYGLRLDEAIKIKYKMRSFTSILKCSSTTHISSGLEWKTIDTKNILTVPTEWIRIETKKETSFTNKIVWMEGYQSRVSKEYNCLSNPLITVWTKRNTVSSRNF